MLSALSFVLLLSIPADRWPGARYGILFLAAIGINVPVTGGLSWATNNLAGSWKRSIGVATMMTVVNLGGVVGSNIYIQNEAPWFWTGNGVSLGITVSAITACYVLTLYCKKRNQQREAMSDEEVRARFSDQELTELGDKSPLYRYVY